MRRLLIVDLEQLVALLSRKRLLIFDLDGTLVDSSPLHARAFSDIFAAYNVRVDYDMVAGMTTGAAVDRLVSHAGLVLARAQREKLIEAKRTRALQLIKEELRPLEGAVAFVAGARQRFDLALCTSASTYGAHAALLQVGLENAFDTVLTEGQVRQGKPDPEMFLTAISVHGAAPDQALVFEDSDAGVEAARRAAIDFVRIGRGEGDVLWPSLSAALEKLG